MSRTQIELLEQRALFSFAVAADFQTAGLEPASIVGLGTKVIFTGRTDAAGRELWVSDGTTTGTKLLADIMPGSEDSDIRGYITVGRNLYFTADTAGGSSLWRTDGTAAGTIQLTYVADYLPQLAAYQNKLYFSSGSALWKTDGTVAGTVEVKNFGPVVGYGNSASNTKELQVAGNYLYVALNGYYETINQLWRVSGTTGSAERLTTMKISRMETVGSDLYLSGSTDTTTGMWKVTANKTISNVNDAVAMTDFVTDGTTSYFLGTASAGTGLFKFNNGEVQFLASSDVKDPDAINVFTKQKLVVANHQVMWISLSTLLTYDTASQKLSTLKQGSTDLSPAADLIKVGNSVLVSTYLDEFEGVVSKVYITNGTSLGTKLFNLYPKRTLDYVGLQGSVVGGKMYMPMLDTTMRAELGSINTDQSNPVIITKRKLTQGQVNILDRTVVNGKLYTITNQHQIISNYSYSITMIWQQDSVDSVPFAIYSRDGDYNTGAASFWVAGGHLYVQGMEYFEDVPLKFSSAGMPEQVTSFDIQSVIGNLPNGKLVGINSDSEIVLMDGSSADKVLGNVNSQLAWRKSVRIGNAIYFVMAADGVDYGLSSQLWRTDGTLAGTYQVNILSVLPESDGSNYFDTIYESNGKIFALVNVGDGDFTTTDRTKIFKLDTATNAKSAYELVTPGVDGSVAIGAIGGALIIYSNDYTLGLLRSDATAAGTRTILTNDETNLYDLNGIAVVNGKLMMGVKDFVTGQYTELWTTDGSLAKPVNIPLIGSAAEWVVNGNDLYYVSSIGQTLVRVENNQSLIVATLPIPDGGYEESTFGNPVVFGGQIYVTGLSSAIVENPFAYKPDISITGTVFNDTNKNAKLDIEETGLTGWKVFIDSNSNGVWDVDERYVYSDSAGKFSLRDVVTGTYKLRVIPAAKYKTTTPNPFGVNIFSGQTQTATFGAAK